jgi:hypothetical protein
MCGAICTTSIAIIIQGVRLTMLGNEYDMEGNGDGDVYERVSTHTFPIYEIQRSRLCGMRFPLHHVVEFQRLSVIMPVV